MASYRYLRDITPEDLAPEKEPELTRRQKWNNWWHYHWILVAACCAAGALVLYFIYSVTLGRAPEPDYQIAVISPSGISTDASAQLEKKLEALADDANGDGHVVVQVNVYTISYADKEAARSAAADAAEFDSAAASSAAASGSTQSAASGDSTSMGENFLGAGTDVYGQMAGDIQLSTDLESNASGIFLLYDPAGFESYSAALRYLDGTNGETDADGYGPDDWYNMVYKWTDCPVLEALGLDSDLGDYYVGFRGIWTDASREALTDDDAFFAKLTAGAVSTAADDAASGTAAAEGAASSAPTAG